MTLLDYLPVLIQILLAVGMGFGILFASHLFGQKAIAGKIKDSPYECGLAADTKGETRYSVKFYITAMLFILFDIDVVFPDTLGTYSSRPCRGRHTYPRTNAFLYFHLWLLAWFTN